MWRRGAERAKAPVPTPRRASHILEETKGLLWEKEEAKDREELLKREVFKSRKDDRENMARKLLIFEKKQKRKKKKDKER